MKHLAMFCKYWEPGRIKTRWGAQIGDRVAASAAAVFQRILAERFAGLGDQRSIVYSPAERRSEFQQLAGERWTLIEQSGGDLGGRLASFAESALVPDARLVLIGSDSPDLPTETIQIAFDLLQSTSAVIGPAEDGGYYLLGLSRSIPDLFREIPWSSHQVFEISCDRLRAGGWSFHVLPSWYDVDDEASWRRCWANLSEQPDIAGPYAAELERIMNSAETVRSEGSVDPGGSSV